MIFGSLRTHASTIAVDAAGETITCQALVERAEHLAARLEAAGAGPGVCVVVVARPGIAHITALLACLATRAVFVPVSLSATAAHGSKLLALAEGGLLVLAGVEASELPPEASLHPLIDVDAGSDTPMARPTPRLRSDAAYVFGTSATSGISKAILGDDGALRWFCTWFADAFGLGPGVRVSQLAPVGFDASLKDILPALLSGATVCVPAEGVVGDPDALAAWMHHTGLVQVQCVPSLWRQLSPSLSPAPPSLRRVLLSGEPLYLDEVRRWGARLGPVVELVNLYGLTEGTILQACQRHVEQLEGEALQVPIGRAIPGCELYLIDDDGRVIDAPDQRGMLHIASPHLTHGYLDAPDGVGVFVPDPVGSGRVCATGDLAQRNADGTFTVLGRRDSQIKLSGVRTDLAEIEHTLLQSGVHEVAVVASEDQGTWRVAGFYTGTPSEGELLEALQRAHGPRMRVVHLVHLDSLPRSVNGKIDRRLLRERLAQPSAPGGEAPTTQTERAVARIWEAILGHDDFDRDSSFFAVGGSSISVVKLIAQARQDLGVAPSLKQVFQDPHLRSIADTIDALLAAAPPAAESPATAYPATASPATASPATASPARVEPAGARTSDPGKASAPAPGAAPQPGSPELDRATAPLSPPQLGVWVQHRVGDSPEAWVAHRAILVEGSLTLELLTDALRRTVATHEILRTTFHGPGPHQRVHPPDAWSLQATRYDGPVPAPGQPWPVPAERFDLSRGPLLRLRSRSLGDDRHVVLLTVHQILVDEVALTGLLLELVRGALAPSPPGAPPVARYRDDVVALTALDTPTPAAGAFWREQLAQLRPQHLFPPATQQDRAERIYLGLDARAVHACDRLAQHSGCTPFVAFRAALSLLLSHYLRSDQVCIGSPVTLRDRIGAGDRIGLYADLVPLSVQLEPEESLDGLLQRLHAHTSAVLEHAGPSLATLLREQGTARTELRPFDVVLVYHEPPPVPELGTWAPSDNATRKFGLTLLLDVRREGGRLVDVQATLEYPADAWHRDEAERFVHQLEAILRSGQAAPDGPVRAIACGDPLLPTEPPLPPPRDQTLVSALRAAVQRDPAAIAYQDPHRTLSYRALQQAADAVSSALAEEGIATGARIGLVCGDPLPTLVGLLGILCAGCAYVPVDSAAPVARRDRVLELAQPARTVTCDDVLGWLESPAPAPPPGRAPAPEDAAYVLFTSGTTGAPKGVVVEHRQVCSLLHEPVLPIEVGPQDAWLWFHAPTFDFSVWEIFGALLSGGRLVGLEPALRPQPDEVAARILDGGVTILSQVPSAFGALAPALLRHPGAGALAVRHIVFGGERVSGPALQRFAARFPSIQLHNLYGITETCVHVTHKRLGAHELASPHSNVGRALGNAALLVVDRFDQPAPVGIPGEILVSGHGLARGYLGDPSLTEVRFVHRDVPPGRWYRSGDLGRWREDGDLIYLGRLDRQVQIRGHRVEPAEIEAALLVHGALTSCHVTALPGPGGRRELAAFCVGSATPQALRAHLGQLLPSYMVPAAIVSLEALPLGPNGKLDASALPDPWADSPTAADPADVLGRLCQLYADALGRQQVAPDDDFFELGGHSLVAAQLAESVASALALRVRVRDVFEASTPRALLARAEPTPGPAASIPVLPDADTRPLLGLQARLLAEHLLRPADAPKRQAPFVLWLEEPVRPDVLQRCVEGVLARHDALAATYDIEDGVALQRRGDPDRAPLALHDLREHPDPAAELARIRSQLADRPLDLAHDGPLALTLVWLGSERAALLISMHHVISDFDSYFVFARDLLALYRAQLHDRPNPLPDRPLQYHDHAHWQAASAEEPQARAARAHWRRALASARQAPLLVERERTAGVGGLAEVDTVSLSPDQLGAIDRLSQELRTTRFVILQAALKVVTSCFREHPRVALASPVSTRIVPASHDAIGPFLSLAVLPDEIDMVCTFAEIVRTVHATTTAALEHRAIPLELAEAPGQPPAYDVGFTLQVPPRVLLDALRPSRLEPPGATAGASVHVALWFEAVPGDEQLDVHLYAHRGVLSSGDRARLAALTRWACGCLPGSAGEPLWQALEHADVPDGGAP